MYDDDYLRTLTILKEMVYVPDYVDVDEDTYAFGTLEAMNVVLDGAIEAVKKDMEKSRKNSEAFYRAQYELNEKRRKENDGDDE